MSRFCANCGTQMPDDAVFCEICGARMMPVNSAPQPSSGAPQATIPRPQFGTQQPQATIPQPQFDTAGQQAGAAQTEGAQQAANPHEAFKQQIKNSGIGISVTPEVTVLGKKKRGWKPMLIGLAAVVAVIAGLAIYGGMDDEEEENGTSVQIALPDEAETSEDASGQGSTQEQETSDEQAALVAALDVLGGGAAGKLAGDYVLQKTTEDVEPKEDDGYDEGSESSSESKGSGISASALGRKANSIAGRGDSSGSAGASGLPDGLDEYDPSTFAYSGGSWDALPDGTFLYENENGVYLRNQWVEDRGVYYYLGPDGAMIKDNYAADGFYCGEDGAWDRNVAQRMDDAEPRDGTYVGYVSSWEIQLLKNGTYGTATFSYTSFGGEEEYELVPLGHSCYMTEHPEYGYEFSALIVVSEDGRTITVSQAGVTEVCTLQ